MCMFIVSKALLISSATVIVRTGEAIFLKGRFIEINKTLYRIVEKKRQKKKYKETNNREKDGDTWQL